MVALAIAIQLFFTFNHSFGWQNFITNVTYNFFLILPIWLGNGYIAGGLSKYVSWIKEPGKRFILSVLAMLLYSTCVFLLLNIIFYIYIRGNGFDIITSPRFHNMMLFQVGITTLITFVMYSLSFFHSWRELAVNEEKLKREHLRAEYEVLRAQVNPHFLFNSLNALTSLVETDQRAAVKFIRKLSEVYRYVLDSRQKEVVPLTEELAFLNSYIYLQKIRHGDALCIQNDLPESTELMVVPLALQMLLENAIKHNIAMEEQPLQVRLYLKDGFIVISNNLMERKVREASTGTGLTNLQARYSYLTDKKVLIERSESDFTVKLPLLYLKG
ncbi:sensor histidine kinase [Pontibacter sp. MBLB2868]|uniref:sensor histidine kinase n=1 Tax=Pontibacter sp. MBLB2868 TaxID=3451555 RepID=UPI003F753617